MKTMLWLGLVGVAMLTAGVVVGHHAPPHWRDVLARKDDAARPDDAPPAGGRPAPRCWEATVYLPLADNAGQPFSERAWQDALAELVVPFGGATLGTPHEGCWLDAHGRVCREPIRPVVVSFPTDRLDEFRTTVRTVGRRLGQEAVYVRFEEPRVELVPGVGR